MLNHIERFPQNPPDLQRERNEFNQYIHPTCRIIKSSVGEYVDLFANTTLIESSIDDYSYTAGNVQAIYTEIGKFCSIANSTVINPGNHPMWRVTQHHFTYRRKQYGFDTKDDDEFFNWRREHKCTLGHDIWIGHGAIILPGVTVGTGAVIGAGSVVTKDIPPYSIAVGVPAKVIKKRFSDDIITQLLKTEWWDWSREKIEASFNDLLDLDTFLKTHA
jgi:phosphonate metabolism protein (transferase hexapeptide repeat family)